MSYIGKQPTKAPLTASDIEDGIITAAKIEDGAVVAAEIASNAVTTAKINADAVTSAKIADNAVVTAAINADAITGAKIADDAINSEHYTDGSIDTAHIADSNVTQAKIADQAINEAKLQISNAPTNGYMLTAQSGNTGGLTWAEAGAGKIGQVINSQVDYLHSTTGTSAVDLESSSGVTWETAITPSATSSKILAIGSVCIYNAQNGASTVQENRYFLHFDQKIGSGSYSAVMDQNWMGHYYYNGTTKVTLDPAWRSFSKLITTNTTDEIKYKFQFALHGSGGKVEVGGDGKKSSLTLIEVLA